ncbi:unnamed protein product [Echinostoma caproni]|uniref:Reverse transcriptase domain-containing protein n=1 Tax=Echinostoma caproni TaxID=27848 RepID=A0A183B4U6_9TREM|nr:unnamed protein product [Echinostoma caproni]
MDLIMDSGIDLLPDSRLADLEYADIVQLNKDPGKLQAFLDSFSASVAMFAMRFTLSKCKMSLKDWVGSAPNLKLIGAALQQVDKVCYLDSYIPPGGRITDEVSARI